MAQIHVILGDITECQVDAIVNAANPSLLGGGGVDGAIHRAGGPEILRECKSLIEHIGHCETGQAVITTGGNLPARKVIHTVGPVWHGGKQNEEKLLADCYFNSLTLALEHNIQSIAFPNISTGVYGFPKDLAAPIAVNSVRQFLKDHPQLTVYFVCFSQENYDLYYELVESK